MKHLIMALLFLAPGFILAQGVNKYTYDNDGHLAASYRGANTENYMFIKYHSNGLRSETGTFKNGVKHGAWKIWNEDGKLESIAHYKNGEKTGKWIIKDDAEQTTFEINFNHNQMLSALKKDTNGQVIARR